MPETNSTTETVKHSPGPWRVADRGGEIARIFAGSREQTIGNEVAVIYASGPAEHQANARLIASAPELLEACALFTAAAHEARDILNGKGFACPASIALAAEKARNAIAKAEGRS